MKKKITLLFFLASSTPTEEESAAADKLAGAKVQLMFRNASAVADGDKPEKADFVAGAVPAPYASMPRPNDDGTLPIPEEPAEKDIKPKTAEELAAEAEAAEERKQLEEFVAGATVAQLKQGLTDAGIEFPSNANKAALSELYLAQ